MSDLTLDQAQQLIRTWEVRRIELADALSLADSSLRKVGATFRKGRDVAPTELVVLAGEAGAVARRALQLALNEAAAQTEYFKTVAARLFAEQQAPEAAR